MAFPDKRRSEIYSYQHWKRSHYHISPDKPVSQGAHSRPPTPGLGDRGSAISSARPAGEMIYQLLSEPLFHPRASSPSPSTSFEPELFNYCWGPCALSFLLVRGKPGGGVGRRAGVRDRLEHNEGAGELSRTSVLISACFLGAPQKRFLVFIIRATAAASLSPSLYLVGCYYCFFFFHFLFSPSSFSSSFFTIRPCHGAPDSLLPSVSIFPRVAFIR